MVSRYALIIGNSQYEGFPPLVAPVQDAEQLSQVLENQEVGAFTEVSKLLNASAQEMRVAVSELFSRPHKPDDVLLFYFSGHGELDDDNNLFLIARDTKRGHLLGATSLEAAYITRAMNSARSRRQVIILDSCYSGAIAKGAKGQRIGTRSIFEGNGYGRYVLTASDGLQLSWEGDRIVEGEVSTSFFTHFLVEGLRTGAADLDGDGHIEITELYDYVHDNMAQASSKQKPLKFSYDASGHLVIARNPVTRAEREYSRLTNLLRQAEEAANQQDYPRAEKLLAEVIEAENALFSETAKTQLLVLRMEQSRAAEYEEIKSLLLTSPRTAKSAWLVFSSRYADFDPANIGTIIAEIIAKETEERKRASAERKRLADEAAAKLATEEVAKQSSAPDLVLEVQEVASITQQVEAAASVTAEVTEPQDEAATAQDTEEVAEQAAVSEVLQTIAPIVEPTEDAFPPLGAMLNVAHTNIRGTQFQEDAFPPLGAVLNTRQHSSPVHQITKLESRQSSNRTPSVASRDRSAAGVSLIMLIMIIVGGGVLGLALFGIVSSAQNISATHTRSASATQIVQLQTSIRPTVTNTVVPSATDTPRPPTSTPTPFSDFSSLINPVSYSEYQANRLVRFARVTASSANIRSGPGTNYPAIETASRRESYEIVSEDITDGYSWYQIALNSGVGWISSTVVETYEENRPLDLPQILTGSLRYSSDVSDGWPSNEYWIDATNDFAFRMTIEKPVPELASCSVHWGAEGAFNFRHFDDSGNAPGGVFFDTVDISDAGTIKIKVYLITNDPNCMITYTLSVG